MATVTGVYAASPARLVTLCDCTPPRSADAAALDAAADVGADFVCVAYNPGKLPRADSAAAAAALHARTLTEVVFNLATRDMNRLALQSRLLGAHMLGLENVVFLQGDAFSNAELEQVRAVNDVRPTELVAMTAAMNDGVDYRGRPLRGATSFCIGATVDLGRAPDAEAALAARKVAAGAHFLITQPFFDLSLRRRFLESYESLTGAELSVPVFWGVQVLVQDGLTLGGVPPTLRTALEAGRPGADIAAELLRELADDGARGVYLVPPILRSGARDYAAARDALSQAGASSPGR